MSKTHQKLKIQKSGGTEASFFFYGGSRRVKVGFRVNIELRFEKPIDIKQQQKGHTINQQTATHPDDELNTILMMEIYLIHLTKIIIAGRDRHISVLSWSQHIKRHRESICCQNTAIFCCVQWPLLCEKK